MKTWVLAMTAVLLTTTFACSAREETAPQPSQAAGSPQATAPQGSASGNSGGYKVEVFAEQLDVPWDIAFVPDGRIFITERPGTIRVIDKGKLVGEPVLSFKTGGIPFQSRGESGLLGIVPDPEFANNGYMYVYHTYEERGSLRNRVLRLVEKNNKATIDKVLIDGLPGQSTHDGGRIRFGPDGYLYFTVGDAQDPQQSQDPTSRAGKIMRIAKDGTIPKTNPFPDSPVYSYGHRNPQGLAWHPMSGRLYASEHGQSTMDEINLIEPGANYGWPLIEGDAMSPKQGNSVPPNVKLRTPILHSGSDTWAPSGMTFVTKGPWKNDLVVASLRGAQLLKVTLQEGDPAKVVKSEKLYKNEWGRLRNVSEGPDGALYVMTNNRDGRGSPKPGDDKIIRLTPQ
ncbi:PQQ-dependent sugar dehydrogenase [Paenibacillus koleovorans]|uniref:PQQ-dependent sugar dehydrogenase n=1 Tax=Paenibacillus koleovorans TaxID=121608 RepID=UPI001FE81E02|nr:PQQ-dependent sugar dehydrogenase [Paenibacillus koleovorans]